MNKKTVIIGGVVLLLLYFATTSNAATIDLNEENMSNFLGNSSYTRGIRTNNPLNIKKSKRDYYGKVPLSNNTDEINEQFIAFPFGIAAAIVHIRSRYITGALGEIKNCVGDTLRPPFNTISKIANVWAPKGCDPGPNIPQGNQPDEYANFISKETGFNTNMVIDGNDKAVMSALLKAMCLFENGVNYRKTVFASWEKDFGIAWYVSNI
jgi:hypothetical protein